MGNKHASQWVKGVFSDLRGLLYLRNPAPIQSICYWRRLRGAPVGHILPKIWASPHERPLSHEQHPIPCQKQLWPQQLWSLHHRILAGFSPFPSRQFCCGFWGQRNRCRGMGQSAGNFPHVWLDSSFMHCNDCIRSGQYCQVCPVYQLHIGRCGVNLGRLLFIQFLVLLATRKGASLTDKQFGLTYLIGFASMVACCKDIVCV